MGLGEGGKFEVEQQNNWGHNMLPWKEGRKQQQQGSACLQNSTQTRRGEVSLNSKNFFLMVNPYKI